MIENDTFEINLEKLQNQVDKEILAEQKYLRENDAKLRAVEQRVPTYDDFRQMVLASHLKPLDKGETLRDNMKKGAKVWNSVYSADSKTKDTGSLNLDNASNLSVDLNPKTNSEFTKIWKIFEGSTSEKEKLRWNFLKNLGIEKISNLFKVEINGELLGNFFVLFENILKNEFSNESAQFVMELLNFFPKTGRFKLNMMFLKNDDVCACKNLFEILTKNGLSVEDLKKFYFD
ncbi:coiled-coil domain-containing protein [Brachionus plicatilis]|uniref:Coiled-coil domain-containing protein n=1 Tax=Brachionus plicatilis TaxID=10195 RepID=A0A3M7SZQ1_BRAPC|nr:coiled-coil domain-containing protein [Brachionus plicatilis]